MPEPRERDLFELLGVHASEAAFASLVAWLLDPRAEHALGAALHGRLNLFLAEADQDVLPDEGLRLAIRDEAGETLIAIEAPGRRPLLVVHRAHEGGPFPAYYDLARQADVIGLAPDRSAFLGASFLLVWPYREVLRALQNAGRSPYAHLLLPFQARVDRLLQPPAPPQRREAEPAAAPAEPSGESAVAEPERVEPELAEPESAAAPAEGVPPAEARRGGEASSLAAVMQQAAGSLVEIEGPSPADSGPSLAAEMLLSDDMSRAYVVRRKLGRGGQGHVYEVSIQGDQDFSDFARPVSSAVIKLANETSAAAIRSEAAIYKRVDPGVIRLLDVGSTASGRPYLVLERLHPHPGDRDGSGRVPVGHALDIFVHLLHRLRQLHFRREGPLVLCDIKPDNVMLRMSNDAEELSDEEYWERLSEGRYEPVFMDLGCAQDKHALDAAGGATGELIGTPLYLPPESVPVLREGKVQLGTYSRKTDVYSLSLALYELIAGVRPYAHRGLYELSGNDLLLELFALKEGGVAPVDEDALWRVVDEDEPLYIDLRDLLDAGLAAQPDRRASAEALARLCQRKFGFQRVREERADYRFDEAHGLLRRQTRLPLVVPEPS